MEVNWPKLCMAPAHALKHTHLYAFLKIYCLCPFSFLSVVDGLSYFKYYNGVFSVTPLQDLLWSIMFLDHISMYIRRSYWLHVGFANLISGSSLR